MYYLRLWSLGVGRSRNEHARTNYGVMKTFDLMKNVERRDIKPLAKKVILLTVARGTDEGGICTYVSIRDLMRASGVGEAQVSRHLDALEADGHMKPRQRRGSSQNPRHSLYQVIWIKPDPREDEPPGDHYERTVQGGRVPVGQILANIDHAARFGPVDWIEHVLIYEAANLRRKRILKHAQRALSQPTFIDPQPTFPDVQPTFPRNTADIPRGRRITQVDAQETEHLLNRHDERPVAVCIASDEPPTTSCNSLDHKGQPTFSSNVFVAKRNAKNSAAEQFMKKGANHAA